MKKLFIPEWKSFIYVLINTDTSISQISKLNSYKILIFVTVNIFYRLPFWKKYGKYFALCLQICQVLVWTAWSYIMLMWRSCSMARYYQFSCRTWNWNVGVKIELVTNEDNFFTFMLVEFLTLDSAEKWFDLTDGIAHIYFDAMSIHDYLR